ncbi:hypothetical protein ACUWCL_29075, partial [Klebsiella pneumoniae]|uniref:hypothetical protein n=1 Tax=Klebsiella pneumoniae TaxID=573 RepID=UPI004055638B
EATLIAVFVLFKLITIPDSNIFSLNSFGMRTINISDESEGEADANSEPRVSHSDAVVVFVVQSGEQFKRPYLAKGGVKDFIVLIGLFGTQ